MLHILQESRCFGMYCVVHKGPQTCRNDVVFLGKGNRGSRARNREERAPSNQVASLCRNVRRPLCPSNHPHVALRALKSARKLQVNSPAKPNSKPSKPQTLQALNPSSLYLLINLHTNWPWGWIHIPQLNGHWL